MSKAKLMWEGFDLHVGFTEDIEFTLYESDGKTPAVLGDTDHVRFKLAKKAGTEPVLDLSSIAATDNDSIVEIVSRGTSGESPTPAKVNVRFAQDDTQVLSPLGEWHGIIGVVDRAEDAPPDAFKIAGRGPVILKPKPGGAVGAE